MTSDFEAFARKAQEVAAVHEKANAHGRKLGTIQDRFGIFTGEDTPAHIKNALYPMETDAEWTARAEREANDPITNRYGPGMTIMGLFNDPSKMAAATSEEVSTLWDRWFAMHRPEYRHGPYTERFADALKVEANRRGIAIKFAA